MCKLKNNHIVIKNCSCTVLPWINGLYRFRDDQLAIHFDEEWENYVHDLSKKNLKILKFLYKNGLNLDDKYLEKILAKKELTDKDKAIVKFFKKRKYIFF